MIPLEKMRRLEVKQGDTWVTAQCLGQCEPGDLIRMFEPDGSPVEGGDGATEWVVLDQPSIRVRIEEAAR